MAVNANLLLADLVAAGILDDVTISYNDDENASQSDNGADDTFDSDCVIIADAEDNDDANGNSTDCSNGIVYDVEDIDITTPSVSSHIPNEQRDQCPLVLEVQSFDVPVYNERPVSSVVDLTALPEKSSSHTAIATHADSTCPADTDVEVSFSTVSTSCNTESVASSGLEAYPVILRSANAETIELEPQDPSCLSVLAPMVVPASIECPSLSENDETIDIEADDSLCLSISEPVVMVPEPPGTEIPSLSVISAPRTMTEQEAIAAGWISDSSDRLPSPDAVDITRSDELPDSVSVDLISQSLREVDYMSVEPDVISSLETVTLVTLDVDSNEQSTNSMHSPVAGRCEEMSCEPVITSYYAARRKRKPEVTEVEKLIDSKPWDKLEKFLHGNDNKKAGVSDATLENTFAEIQHRKQKHRVVPMDHRYTKRARSKLMRSCRKGDEHALKIKRRRSAKFQGRGGTEVRGGRLPELRSSSCGKAKPGSPPNCQGQGGTKARRGRPPKLQGPDGSQKAVQKIYKVRRTGGRPLTPFERHNLKDCAISLQQLRLPKDCIKVRTVWRYLCCRDLIPDVSIGCRLCHRRKMLEMEVAKKFRSGTRNCRKSAKKCDEFSIEPFLKTSPSKDASKKNMEQKNKEETGVPKKPEPCSSSDPASSSASKDDHKYLLIRAESGMFVVPVDSAVACIVSEQEISQLL